MSEPVTISSIVKDVVAVTSMAVLPKFNDNGLSINQVYFDYGHINDINERIIAKTKLSQEICPLIILIEDYKIRRGREGLTGITNMKVLILYYSNAIKTREQRENDVFIPILYPLYNEFLRQLKLCGKFSIYDETKIQHDQINRPHWGDPGLYGNKEYPLKGIFDGIELSNLQLTTFLNNCL